MDAVIVSDDTIARAAKLARVPVSKLGQQHRDNRINVDAVLTFALRQGLRAMEENALADLRRQRKAKRSPGKDLKRAA